MHIYFLWLAHVYQNNFSFLVAILILLKNKRWKSYISMTWVPLSLPVFCFVLGVGEGQYETEAYARFSGCEPKQVGRVAPKKTAGLGCLPSRSQPHGGWRGWKLSLCLLRAAARLQPDGPASTQPCHPFVLTAQTDLQSQGCGYAGKHAQVFSMEWSAAESGTEGQTERAGNWDPDWPADHTRAETKALGRGLVWIRRPGNSQVCPVWVEGTGTSESILLAASFCICSSICYKPNTAWFCSFSWSALLYQIIPGIQLCVPIEVF